MHDVIDLIRNCVEKINDFPQAGVVFRDIMPLFLDPSLFKNTIQTMAAHLEPLHPTHLVGIESRGFLFAAPLAYHLGCRFVPARKKGKLPGPVHSHTYQLEYGLDTLEIQQQALDAEARYIIVDDVLATGGTALAVNNLLRDQGMCVVANLFLISLSRLGGLSNLKQAYPDLPIFSLLEE